MGASTLPDGCQRTTTLVAAPSHGPQSLDRVVMPSYLCAALVDGSAIQVWRIAKPVGPPMAGISRAFQPIGGGMRCGGWCCRNDVFPCGVADPRPPRPVVPGFLPAGAGASFIGEFADVGQTACPGPGRKFDRRGYFMESTWFLHENETGSTWCLCDSVGVRIPAAGIRVVDRWIHGPDSSRIWRWSMTDSIHIGDGGWVACLRPTEVGVKRRVGASRWRCAGRIVGGDGGGEPSGDRTVWRDQELLEVPPYVAGVALVVGGVHRGGVERVSAGPVR